MNELDAILSTWRTERDAAHGGVLATVVHVSGSAYRRPGARMLILADGRRIGTVSGGCLESDVSKKAWWFTEGGQPAVRAYDTSSDDDAVWEFGLGCNGVVHVLLERIKNPQTQELLRFLDTHRTARRGAVVATVVATSDGARAQIGQRLLLEAGGVGGGSLRGTPLEAEILTHTPACFFEQKSCLVHLADCDVFVEWVSAPVPLVVFGAGHDAIPLVKFAKELGWHVTVADGRANYAQASRFPDADRVVVLGRKDVLAGIEITRESIVVLMTHNYPMDVKLVERILPGKPRYLGLLGPKVRSEKLLAEAGQPLHGVDVHAPVGLDLGSDTPEAIALSIVAEIQASLCGRRGGMLKRRDGAIHMPAEETGRPAELVVPISESAVCELV
ncbi:MAG TPA: XdhC family protein [Bryobacteraceae bacterium]|nr:XdhC family protein [Bryobacteraceae bacterium]